MDKILVIVEGEKTETKFFKRLSELTNNEIITISYNNNIYNLYKCLKDSGSIDTVRMLIYGDNNVSDTDKKILKDNIGHWPYIYLVFDFDYQHCKHLKKVNQELDKINELASYFTDEADKKGKLLIDYPMMESFKDLADFEDITFLDSFIEADFNVLSHYKEKTAKNGVKKDISNYTKYDMFRIAKLNLIKINNLLYQKKKLPSYDDYFRLNNYSQRKIFESQVMNLKNKKQIVIINSAILLYVDLNPKILKND